MHAKENVRAIAQKELGNILLAGVSDNMSFSSKGELVETLTGLRMKIKLGKRTSADFGDQNVIKKYSILEDNGGEKAPSDIPF